MNKKLQNILYKQQTLEYIKKQNITSRHPFQELQNHTANPYALQFMKQCTRINHRTKRFKFSFAFSNILTTVIFSIAMILLLNAWVPHPDSDSGTSTKTLYALVQEAIDCGDAEKARSILENNQIPSTTFAGALAYSSLYELEENYDRAADVIITFITDILGTQSIVEASPLYTRMTELDNMKLSPEKRAKFDTCMDACKQSAAVFTSISTLIESENYELALQLCDTQKAMGSSEYILFDFYHTCYTNLKEYEAYALKLINIATEVLKEKEFSYQLPEKTLVKYYLTEVYPHVSLETQEKINALNII